MNKNTVCVSVQQKRTNALCDTGASVSCASKSFFDRIFPQGTNLLKTSDIPSILGVGGTKHEILGKVRLNVCIGKKAFAFDFYVVTDLHHSLILGIDFMNQHKVVIDVRSKLMSLSDNAAVCNLVTSKSYARTTKPVKISAYSYADIKVKIARSKNLNKPVLLEPHANLAKENIAGARCLVSAKKSKAVLRVVNPTENDVYLKNNKVMAIVSGVNHDQIIDWDNLECNSEMQKENASSSKMNFDLSNSDLNEGEKERLLKLLHENEDIFSEGLHDLGKTTLAEHVIHTQSSIPVKSPYYKQSPEMRRWTKEYTDKLQESGIIKESDSNWHSPVVLVKREVPGYSFIAIMVLMFWSLTTVTVSASNVQRVNYGIVFEKLSSLQLSQESWIHTFEIPLPEQITFTNPEVCKKKQVCSVVNEILNELSKIRKHTEIMINQTIDNIERLIPERVKIVHSRSRRSILPFIGSLSKSLFGTATMEDVELLAKHINALKRSNKAIVSSIQQHEEHLSSYIQSADNRMTNLMSGIKNNEQAILNVQNEVVESYKSLQNNFVATNILVTEQLEKSRKLEIIFKELLNGVYDIVEGKLSPALISVQDMEKTLYQIQALLHEKYHGFHLVYSNSADIYSHAKTIFARQENKLYISVKFPISPYPKPLSLYKVISLPVPVNDSSDHATQILDLKPLLAITHDNEYYVPLDYEALNNCKRSSVMSCEKNLVTYPKTHSSCIFALYINDKALIKENCNFRFLSNHLKPQISELDDTSILVYNVELLELNCKSKKQMLKGCKFCVIKVPCHCDITTPTAYLPPRLSKCQNFSTSVLHPVNLALMQQFFNDSVLADIEAHTLFDQPLDVNIPKFVLYNHSMMNVIADDRKSHLNLQKMAEAAKKDAAVFQSLSEPLLSGYISIEEEWPSTNDILLYITMAVAILSLVLLILTAVKLRKLMLIVSVLQTNGIQKCSATPLKSFHYKNPENIETPSVIMNAEIEHYILIICICTFITTSAILYFVYKSKSQRTTLIMELATSENQIFIPILSLSLCPSFWKVKVPTSISSLSISGKLFPILHVDWQGLEIKHVETDKIETVSSTLSISPFQGRKVRKITSRTYSVHFYISFGKYLIPIKP